MEIQPGRLWLAGTPLGNPGDASARLRAALARSAMIAAEDTRRVRRLARDLDVQISGRVLSHFEGNEVERVPVLLKALAEGQDVLVVSDAGMPAVSDPGFRLVVAAVEAGYPVSCLPGPSAVLTALAVSGLPVDRFCFEGFLPRKAGERSTALRELGREPRTMVFFEAPHRLAATLEECVRAFGADRRAAVCRELTKTHEEIRRAPLGVLAAAWAIEQVRGEITLVVAGAPPVAAEADPGVLAHEVTVREAAGQPRKEAIAEVAAARSLPKRLVFDAVVAAKKAH